MKECRCKRCNKLLAKAEYELIEIKCPRCKRLNRLKATEPLTTAPSSANVKGEQYGQTNHPVDGG